MFFCHGVGPVCDLRSRSIVECGEFFFMWSLALVCLNITVIIETLTTYRVVSFVRHVAIGAGGLGFDSRAGKIRDTIANGSPPLRRFF